MCGFVVLSGEKKIAEKNLHHRGPDDYQEHLYSHGIVSFYRLAIMDLSHHGRQPFFSHEEKDSWVVCNGEIYNYHELKSHFLKYRPDFQFQSGSDCEVILPWYEREGMTKLVEMLDGEFSLVLWDAKEKVLKAARDPMGIRPLFMGTNKSNREVAFASEAKALKSFCIDIRPFPPGHYYDGKNIVPYLQVYLPNKEIRSHIEKLSYPEILHSIKNLLTEGVHKRLQSDAAIGYLLSGGLDSSLVCAIAKKFRPEGEFKTFSIGMEDDAIDSKYAEIVAKYIGAKHTSVVMTKSEVLAAVSKVIYHLETWDITTIRASIGMYKVCEYIKANSDIKVLLTGEVSDELLGYKYTDFAPSKEAFQEEAEKRIRELYLFDVLRADRCIAAHSLEARVPFSDDGLVQFIMNINPELKLINSKFNTKKIGKYLLREAFAGDKLLPEEILWRDKAAFSDAVGHSMVDYLKEHAESLYSDSDLKNAVAKYPINTPFTKEALWYRDIFESHFPDLGHLIPHYWMPNSQWKNCDVKDPSARVLSNYGKSGK